MATELIVSTADLAIMMTDLQGKANDLLEQANRADIGERKDYENGTDYRKIVNGIRKRLEDQRKGLVDPYGKRVRSINAEFKTVRDTLDQADGIVKVKMLTWHDEEEKKQRIEQEKQRREAEEAALDAAEEREEAGDAATAETILNMASEVPEPDPQPTIGRGSMTGASSVSTKRLTARVDNIKHVCQAIADGHIPEDFVVFPKSKLNELARKWGEDMADNVEERAQYGIVVFREKNLSVR